MLGPSSLLTAPVQGLEKHDIGEASGGLRWVSFSFEGAGPFDGPIVDDCGGEVIVLDVKYFMRGCWGVHA